MSCKDERYTFFIRVILICVPALYSVSSCMSVTANLYGCTDTLDETPVIAPKLLFPKIESLEYVRSTRTSTKVLR